MKCRNVLMHKRARHCQEFAHDPAAGRTISIRLTTVYTKSKWISGRSFHCLILFFSFIFVFIFLISLLLIRFNFVSGNGHSDIEMWTINYTTYNAMAIGTPESVLCDLPPQSRRSRIFIKLMKLENCDFIYN